MVKGINYSKWDNLEVSDSEDEEDAHSREMLKTQHKEVEEAADAQRKLRELINEHQSGKPLEAPEEVRDILNEPFWCDEPEKMAAEVAARRASPNCEVADQPTSSTDKGAASVSRSQVSESSVKATADVKVVPSGGRRRDFADWDKLKLDEDSDDESKLPQQAAKPPDAVEKVQQLMQLQEGLNKMRKDREERQRQIQEREQRILERDGLGNAKE